MGSSNSMRGFKKKLTFLTLGIIFPLSLQTSKVYAGSFGAEIFCTMFLECVK